jgi:hypothetical protein
MLLFADLAVRDYSRRGISPPGEVQKTIDEGRTAVLNVVTDSRARAETGAYARYRT